MFHCTNPDTGSHMFGYLNKHQAEIWDMLREAKPERYKDDVMLKLMSDDVRAVEAAEKEFLDGTANLAEIIERVVNS